MPITPTYPGVYIQELASDVRTIVPVETATAAFIGRALRGPVNEPVTIFSFGEFEQIFGGLWVESQLGYAVSDFFLNGGGKAIIVRAYRPALDASNNKLPAQAQLRLLSSVGAAAVEAAKTYITASRRLADIDVALDEARKSYTSAGADTGKQADARDKYVRALAPRSQALIVRGDAEKILEAARRLDDNQGTAAERTAVNGLIDKAIAIKNNDKVLIGLQKTDELKVEQPLETADTDLHRVKEGRRSSDGTKGLLVEADNLAKDIVQFPQSVELKAVYEGAWGNRLVAQVTQETDERIQQSIEKQYTGWGLKASDFYNVRIRDLQTGVEEYFPNVTLVNSPRRLEDILASQSQLVRLSNSAVGKTYSISTEDSSNKPWWETTAARKVEDARGSDGAPLEDDDIKGKVELVDGVEVKSGLKALDDVDIFNLLCIPPYKTGAQGFEDVTKGVIDEAAAYCEKRRAIMIVDAPAAWRSWSQAKEHFPTDIITPIVNAAIFFPRIKKPNPLRDNQVEEFAPCGAIAGVIARTDFRRGVWKAPAGLEATLRGVSGFSVPLDDNANGQLNPLGINCLRVMPAAGPVVWGARTTEGDDRLASQWKYLPVRRMALWIEETLYRSTHWAVFEPNDEPLWSSLRLNIGNFMNGLFRQGAFQGRTPAEAYFVRCDAATTPQTDIDRGIVNVIVGFAPLKPAEFVVISIKQITNQGAPA